MKKRATIFLIGLFLIGACAAVVLCASPSNATPFADQSDEVTFTEYTPLSSNLEMARRMLSPLTAARIPGRLAETGKALADQPIDLKSEKFRIYVPRTMPAAGYGLLVFVPPWDDDIIPPGWTAVLASKGVIFVSGDKTGNTASPLGRRDPLALLATYNVMRRYKVDPRRIYIAGFSGGSRVALRLAVGYPDVYTGALLDAGADPLGEPDFSLPPRDLFDRLRTVSRLDYLAGTLDEFNQQQQDVSVASLRHWCVVNVTSRSKIGLGHDIAPPSALATALNDLDEPRRAPTAKDADCWTRVTRAIDEELATAEAALTRADFKAAKAAFDRIDKRFGGLGSPRSVGLMRKPPLLH